MSFNNTTRRHHIVAYPHKMDNMGIGSLKLIIQSMIEPFGIAYVVCCLERGEKEEKEHYHIYLRYNKPHRLTAIKKALHDSIHGEECYAGDKGNRNYILHEGSHNNKQCELVDWFEIGEYDETDKPVKKGMGKDVEEFRQALENMEFDLNLSDKEIKWNMSQAHFPLFLKYFTACNHLLSLSIERARLSHCQRHERTWKPVVQVFAGVPGTGKSRKAKEENPGAYWTLPGKIKWFDGYNGQEAVIFDDFDGNCDFGFLLRLLDRYPLTVECKGGSVPFLAKKIVLTSNLKLEDWYDVSLQRMTALKRRVDSYLWFYAADCIKQISL